MIKLLEDLLIEATTNPNVPGSLVAGLRKAVETARAACGLLPPPFDSLKEVQRAASTRQREAEMATVRAKPGALQTHRICVKAGGSNRVGDMVAGACHVISEGNWAPCDKDGWVQAGTAYEAQPGLIVDFDCTHNAWRPAQPPQVSAIDEMAEQMKRWAEPTRSRDPDHECASTPALAVQEGGSHYKDMKIQPVEYIHANGLGYFEGNVVKYVSRWRAKGGLQDLKKARHYLDLIIEMEGGTK